MLMRSLKHIFPSASVMFGILAIATTVAAQVEPQQGAINNREVQTGPAIKGVWVRLAKSHELTHVAQSSRVTTTDDAGNFSFADVAPGEYVLTFSAVELKADSSTENERKSGLSDLQGQVGGVNSNSRLQAAINAGDARITVMGAVGGTIDKVWGVKIKQAPDNGRGAANRFDPVMLDASAKTWGPGRPVFGNITLLMDSSSSRVRGHVSLIK